MSGRHTPWSRSRSGDDLPADRFGSLDPGVLRAAGSGRSGPPRPSDSGSGEAGRRADSESTDTGALPSGAAWVPPEEHALGTPASIQAYTRLAQKLGPGRSAPPTDGAPGSAVRSAYTQGPVERGNITGHEPLDSRSRAGAWDQAVAGHSVDIESFAPAYLGGHAMLGLVLGIVVLLIVGSFSLGRVTGPAPGDTAVLTTFAASTEAPAADPPPEREPTGVGSPEVGVGFVFGKVKDNDGDTLTVYSELTSADVTVHTDEKTKLYVLIASNVAGIDVGSPIWVYGRKHADGSISARTIAGVSMHANK